MRSAARLDFRIAAAKKRRRDLRISDLKPRIPVSRIRISIFDFPNFDFSNIDFSNTGF